MARNRPSLIPLQFLIAGVLTVGVALTTIAAAPGPLKSDSVATEVSNPDSEPNEQSGARWQPTDTTQTDARLEYQGAVLGGDGGDTATSLRPAIAGRTTAGSTLAEDVETPVPVPQADPPRSSPRPERLKFAESPYVIVASGRPRNSTDSLLAYDGDPSTSWSAGEVTPMAYAWFDLGEERTVAGLRWFQTVVDGPVAVQISNDREDWTTVVLNQAPVTDSWQQANIGQSARFVRIVVNTENGMADLAEVEIFGPPGAEPSEEEIAIAQTETEPTANRPPRVRITGGGEQGRQAAESAVVTTPEPDSEAVEISVNGEVSRCSGGDRCRVETRAPEIVEDCGDGTTTCTIRIGISGGLAVCDSSGSSRGENSGTGGDCTAESSGGTVEVGDVNR